MDTGGNPRRQETMGGDLAQTRSERVLEKPNEPPLSEGHTYRSREGSMEHTFELMDTVPPTSHDLPLLGGNTPGSDEGRMELIQELMETYTSLSKRVLALEEAKTTQDRVITRLKLRVKRLEKKRKERTLQPMKRRLFNGRVESSDDDLDEEDASKQGMESDKTKSMFQDSDFVLDDDMEYVEVEIVHTATTGVSTVSAPVTTVGVAISTAEPKTPPTTTTIIGDKDHTNAQTLMKMKEEKSKEKGVAIKDVEDSPRPIRSITTLQPLPTINSKDKGKGVLVKEEPEKPEKSWTEHKKKEATSAALAEEFDEIQARIDVDHELAIILTHEEQEKYTIKERARLLAEFFERRKKQLAAKRAEAIRNKPPTRTQVGNKMITYLKHMDDDNQQQAESTKKRPKADSEEESSKKQKLEEDTDAKKEYLRDSIDVSPKDDVAIDVESLATKYPIDGNSKNYKIFSEMLDDFDKQDVTDLHRTRLRNRLRIGINKWYQSFALRNFDLEVMKFESAHSNTTAKLPILKLAQENGTSVTKMSVPVTAEEKTNKKNDVKARSLLLMALPNEHQLTFSQYTDAKTIASSTESLDSIFNRLQKIVSRLAIFGVVITQEDLNLKFLRSLPPEWYTHVVVWMNKAKIETMSIDDLYNNFKIVEQSVKKSVCTSRGAQNLAFMNASSTSSTNDVNTAKPAYEVSTVSSNVNTASPQVSTTSFSDNVVYAFMVKNPNGSNLLWKDLEQIHEDDMEIMDLKWQLSLLSMRAKRECIAPRNKEGQFRNQDNTRKHGNNEDTSSKAMLAIDGRRTSSDKHGSNGCDDLIVKLNQTKFTVATYKRGLAIVEEQLITYRKNEVLFSEEVAVLKREVACKDYEINILKSEFEKVKQEKEGIEFKIKKFDKASKDLDNLLGKPEFKSYGSEDSKKESNIVCDKKSNDTKENYDDSLVKEQVPKHTSSFVESSLNVDKETIFLDKKIKFVKPKNHEKPVKKSVRTHLNAQRNMVPRAVLMKTGLKLFNTVRTVNTAHPKSKGKPQQDDTGFVDSGCSRHMTGNIAYLSDFKEFDRGNVTFGGGAYGGRISSKGTLKTDSLDFEDIYFVNELKFNIFSVSQMCDKKNYVLFTDTECLVLSPNYKLSDESHILLKIPTKDNMYSFYMKNIVPKESLTCLVAKATLD
ncbi:hypothetical protein Tco_0636294 [Tanacetum coccineum]